jgi:YafQ family addiction module toxin component|tara:strand:- start:116 stop:391 length:276 start_codon:yes stop_codon:yes gene_type:complete
MRYDFSDDLKKILSKLKKKDHESFKAVKNKIKEIVSSDPEHYKPLKHDLKNLKRVHIRKSFVLVFEHNKQQELIQFLDYDHHDKIYLKEYR